MSGVRAFDTFGAWQLARLSRELKSRGREVTIIGLPSQFSVLFDAVQKSSEAADRVHPKARVDYSGFAAIGEALTGAWQNFL